MTPNEILIKALNKMPSVFSGNEFAKECRRIGLQERKIANGVTTAFLHKNCMQGETSKTWTKISLNSVVNIDTEKSYKHSFPKDLKELNATDITCTYVPKPSIEECIEILKSTGQYKIYLITQTEI